MTDGEKERAGVGGNLTVTPSLMPSHIVTALLLLTTYLLCVYPLMDTDFWWHLRTGQLIGERGDVPRTDWFLFTDSDRPWIDLHWGFQLLVTALYSVGGVNLVILVKAAVITTAVAIGWFAAGSGMPAWLRALLWIPAVVCITGRGYERPEMLSQLFLAMWLWIAFRVETQPKWIWALPAIQIVWVNCHALFVLGLVVGACFAVDYALRWIARGRFGLDPLPPGLTPRNVSLAGLLCGLAALVNPYLLDGALFPLVLYRKFSVEQAFYSVRIGEFQQPVDFFLRHGFANIYLNTQIQLALMTIASFIAVAGMLHRWSPFRLLLCAGFLHLGWQASRNVNIFAIVAATILTANVAEFWRTSLGKEEAREMSPSPSLLLSHSVSIYANCAVSLLLLAWVATVVSGAWGRTIGEKKTFGLGERPYWFGHEAVKFAGQPGFPDRAIISHIGLAAVYEFHHGPEKKVFMDPRLEVVTQQTFLRQEDMLRQMATGDRNWEYLVRDKQGQLPVVILDSRVSRSEINGLMQTPGWRLVYADPAAAVFLKGTQAEQLGLPAADPEPLKYPP